VWASGGEQPQPHREKRPGFQLGGQSGASSVARSGWLCSLPYWSLLHKQVVKGSLGWFRYGFRETVVAQWSILPYPTGLGMTLCEGMDKSGVGTCVFQGNAVSRAVCLPSHINTLMQLTFTF